MKDSSIHFHLVFGFRFFVFLVFLDYDTRTPNVAMKPAQTFLSSFPGYLAKVLFSRIPV